MWYAPWGCYSYVFYRQPQDVFGGIEMNLPEAPKLAELKSRECTLPELQAALIQLIDLYNEQGKIMEAAINRKQDKGWQATI